MNVLGLVSKHAQIELESGLVAEIEHDGGPHCLLRIVRQFGNQDFLLRILLHHPLQRNDVVIIGHDFRHLFEFLLVAEVGQEFTAIEFNAVALVGLLLLTLDAVSELGGICSRLGDLEIDGDAFEGTGLPVGQIDFALVLQDAHNVTIRRIRIITVK